MKKFKIKSGDTVRVIAGDHKGSEGKVLQIIKDKDRVVVEGVNMISKHTKPSAQSPQGGIVKKEASSISLTFYWLKMVLLLELVIKLTEILKLESLKKLKNKSNHELYTKVKRRI